MFAIYQVTCVFFGMLLIGEDHGYPCCAFLLYDGIHYDPLVWESGGTAPPQGIFPVEDEAVVMDALEIARSAYKVIPWQ